MSGSEFFSLDSETDSEFEDALDMVEWEIDRDEDSHHLVARMRECKISTWRLDGHVLNCWLRAATRLEDVIVCGRLKRKNSTVLADFISEARVEELRELARDIVFFYNNGSQFKSYIDRVTACIISFEYCL